MDEELADDTALGAILEFDEEELDEEELDERPESESRFKRARSVRRSAAL